MSEYKDIKNNVYPIIQRTLDSDESEKERILDALFYGGRYACPSERPDFRLKRRSIKASPPECAMHLQAF